MTRNVVITSADGQTGFLVAELLLTDKTFSSKIGKLTALALHPDKCSELADLGAEVIPFSPDSRIPALVKSLKASGADTIFLIPPAHKDKVKLAKMMQEAAKKANIQNVLLLSSAGADLAERDEQPRLREFIDIECAMMAEKGDRSSDLGHSPCILRAGFYAENLLLYNKTAQQQGKLPLPVGKDHLFAPVALGDIAQLAAHILVGQGKNGFDDKHRGQLIVMTGPMLVTGEMMASTAGKVLGVEMQFEDISEKEAKSILDADTDIDDSEKEYLLEYYTLVRQGKTNYISTIAFNAITGGHPQEPPEFFKTYEAEFKPKRRRMK